MNRNGYKKMPFGRFWDGVSDKYCVWAYHDATIKGSKSCPFSTSLGASFQHFEVCMPEPYIKVSDDQ